MGFGFLALVLSYLPVIYQAFSRREVNIVLLDARAGSPPTACGNAAAARRSRTGRKRSSALLRDWERAAADILESHVSYPAVSYFRSQHNNESWLAALTAILDTMQPADGWHLMTRASRQARLTFAMCRHTVVDLAQLFETCRRAAACSRPPAALPNSIACAAVLATAGFQFRDDEPTREKLAKLREMYEPYLHALSRVPLMEASTVDSGERNHGQLATSAWGRISGLEPRR